jgi:transposase
MDNVTTIGLDIAKSVFQVHGVDAVGQVVIRRKLTRGRVLGFFEKLPRPHEAMMCDCCRHST